MAVDDMCLRALKPEFREDAVDHLFLLQQAVVRVLRLLMRRLVRDKIALKRRHFCFSEHRGILVFPDKPQDIQSLFLLPGINRVVPFSRVILQHIVERLAGIFFSVHIYSGKGSVLVHRHTAVVEQVPVVDLVQAALCEQKTDVTL